MVSGEWSIFDRERSMVNGQQSTGNGQRSMVKRTGVQNVGAIGATLFDYLLCAPRVKQLLNVGSTLGVYSVVIFPRQRS